MKRFVALAIALYAVVLGSLIAASQQAPAKAGDGQQIFRFDTFGDEQLWTKTLRMHEAIATVSPETALAVGLKVDVDALPVAVVEAL